LEGINKGLSEDISISLATAASKEAVRNCFINEGVTRKTAIFASNEINEEVKSIRNIDGSQTDI